MTDVKALIVTSTGANMKQSVFTRGQVDGVICCSQLLLQALSALLQVFLVLLQGLNCTLQGSDWSAFTAQLSQLWKKTHIFLRLQHAGSEISHRRGVKNEDVTAPELKRLCNISASVTFELMTVSSCVWVPPRSSGFAPAAPFLQLRHCFYPWTVGGQPSRRWTAPLRCSHYQI